jgi:hypothetical protein
MWIFSTEFLGLAVLAAVAALIVLVWRARVWLDRWADAMIACYPELLQFRQETWIPQERKKTAALADRRPRDGMSKPHFDQSIDAEAASASAQGTLSGD